ncbi:serine protease gd-like isoform X1 [Apis laboriosa]|uniref:serine protease gd-like isoform X1 n=2 Tax=Apis laboriosa TaxID=183418 RepID=UPI001CC49C11|nr:serine protease gd-like isoform X1 [Apis laboriosa]XP_043787276.1 serine protease gd-like isoform X1 [Apis laboriosa]XP_043787285.1 serine protease gd-like isoform X1 [Apis laboriosa]
MVSVIVKVALLLHILQLIAEAADQSPCPKYFRYISDSIRDEIIGFVEIRSPPKGIPLTLTVKLSIAVALPSKYVGKLELAQPKEQSIKEVMQGRPLYYKIHFPLPWPIPILNGLWFNNEHICSGPRASGPIVTSIVLNHTLYPPSLELNFDSNIPINFPQPLPNFPSIQNKPSMVYQPTVTPQPSPVPIINNQNNVECGRSSNNKFNLLVAGGMNASPGQWPWLVAIFVVKKNFEFQCAGTLVTNKHIITAAHCLLIDSINLPPNTLIVSLGRYHLREWFEKGSVNREIAAYQLHPNYDKKGNADADLAVLNLREKVEYNDVIRPICLWTGPALLASVVGKSGYVVGWGRDEHGNRHLQEPRQIKAPIVRQEDCHWSNSDFVLFTSNRTFCAGLRNGSGPCNGDSGSGFVMYDAKTDRYYLRGIVSRSLLNRTTMSCDLNQYIVYVDVAQHLEWIRNMISL